MCLNGAINKVYSPRFHNSLCLFTKEADVACNPIFQFQKSVKDNNVDRPRSQTETRRSQGARSFSTESNEHYGKGNMKPKTETSACLFCDKRHHIDECRNFLERPLVERKTFAKENGLCFGCLEHGHRAKFCKCRRYCATCGRRHPSSLHGDYVGLSEYKKTDRDTKTHVTSTNSHTRVTHMSDAGNINKCSLIVPVWLSHCDNPVNEILVYALLDTQSDTTFILDKTRQDIGILGKDVNLILSTMSANNQLVESRKVEGLQVRGFDSTLAIKLPATYSREIMSANRAHIPTPEVAMRWSHLQEIAQHIMPLSDIDVGLLIGYNCSRALVPRDVIPPPNSFAPYGQRTDLGWSIVGMVDFDSCDYLEDNIGVSHKIMTLEVNSDLSVNDSSYHEASSVAYSFRTTVKESINPSSVAKMMELDFSEHEADVQGLSFNDRLFIEENVKWDKTAFGQTLRNAAAI